MWMHGVELETLRLEFEYFKSRWPDFCLVKLTWANLRHSQVNTLYIIVKLLQTLPYSIASCNVSGQGNSIS